MPRSVAALILLRPGWSRVVEVPLVADNGQYVYGDDGYPQVIRVRPTGPHPELTVAHEMGHYFDHQAYRTRFSMTKYFASADHEDFEHFREAVDASHPAQELRKILEGDTYKNVNPQGETFLLPVRPVLSEYHQGYNELWARAYAQYIALRSGNLRMREQIDTLLSSGNELNRALQWDWEEFIPIAEAIEEVLEAKACLSRS